MSGIGQPFKGYICHVKRERDCVECGTIKPFEEFSINWGITPKNLCKPCRSYRMCQRRLEKKLDNNSTDHVQCDECCHIQRINKKLKTQNCAKCESRKLNEKN